MKYLGLIYIDRDHLNNALASKSLACAAGLQATGERLPALASIRVRNGQVSAHDGPFIETKG